jgi:GNAT superfamily N-acetyltransferase
MSTSIIITTATEKDAMALTELGVKTFLDTFAAENKKEDMDKYIAGQMSLEKITEELKDTANTFFLAYTNGQLTGYAKVRGTKVPDALKDNKPLELERIYVLHEHHGTKTGAALLQHCIDHALRDHYDVIWLGVWEHNYKAVNFYERWGFEFFGSHVFRLGDDDQTDVLMKKHFQRT